MCRNGRTRPITAMFRLTTPPLPRCVCVCVCVRLVLSFVATIATIFLSPLALFGFVVLCSRGLLVPFLFFFRAIFDISTQVVPGYAEFCVRDSIVLCVIFYISPHTGGSCLCRILSARFHCPVCVSPISPHQVEAGYAEFCLRDGPDTMMMEVKREDVSEFSFKIQFNHNPGSHFFLLFFDFSPFPFPPSLFFISLRLFSLLFRSCLRVCRLMCEECSLTRTLPRYVVCRLMCQTNMRSGFRRSIKRIGAPGTYRVSACGFLLDCV